MSEIREDPILPVHCRPNKSAWIGVVIVGAMGLFFLFAPILALNEPSPKPPSALEAITLTVIFGAIGLAILLGTLWEALWLQRGAIIADETGLRWRNIRTWHNAAWPQVHDYYDDSPYSKHTIIETDVGQLKISRNSISNTSALRDAIQHHATSADVREWGVLSARETDWPRTFGYHPANYATDIRIFSGIAILWFSAFVWGFFKTWETWVEIWEYSSPVIVIIGAAFYFVCSLIFPLFAWMIISMLHETQARIAQRITVTLSGLIFEDDMRRIECTWDEITDYYRDPMLASYTADDSYVVITQSGTFNFTLIENRLLLAEIIKRHATNALYQEWRDYRQQQETGKKGERLYTYRTRMNRALMLLPLSFIFVFILFFFMSRSFGIEADKPADAWTFTMSLFYGLGSVLICAAYFVGSIELSETGITQRGLRGKKFLAWPEITQLRGTKIGGYELVGRDTRLGFYAMIADVKILRDEIERRAINAKIAPSWTATKTH